MALQSSGQISLNDIHVEAGGTTGTQASINDSDIRGLISAAANSQMTFSSFYGASASIGQILSGNQSVTTIGYSQSHELLHVNANAANRVGYATGSPFTLNGRTTHTEGLALNIINDWTLTLVDGVASTGATSHPANSGWSTVTLSGNGYTYSFNRASASTFTNVPSTYKYNGSTISNVSAARWTWTSSDHSNGTTNPFPSTNNTTFFTLSLS